MKKAIKIIIIIIVSLVINIKDINAKELPKVYLEGNITNMSDKNDERKIKLHYISDELEFISYAKIKLQGKSSLSYEKKNYTIKLYENESYKNKKNVSINESWGSQHKYCLKANWIDKTHSRNIVTSNLISDIQKKYNLFKDSPNNGEIDGIPIEIYINNDFLGLYTWNIPKDNWTFNMDNDNPNHIVFAGKEKNNSTLFKEKATYEDWELEVGIENEETLEKLNKLISFVKDSSNTEFKNKFHEYLNLDATLNYYVMLHFANLDDNITKNTLLITYDGKIWYPVLYDLDSSWGTDWKGNTITDYKVDITNDITENLLWNKLVTNFPNEIANRYFDLRKEILSKNYILKKFNKFYNTIPNSTLTKEQNKWKEIPGHSIKQIEEFIDTRVPIIDHLMYKTYDTTPQINIEYSTTKPTLSPVTVTLKPNRNDIIISKNGKKSYEYKYTFKQNGTYTFEYEDWYGNNLGNITIKINCIKTKLLKNIAFSIIIAIIGLLLFITPKKKEKIKTIKEEKAQTTKKEIKKKSPSKKKEPTNKTNKKTPNKKSTKK